ncbi:AI-2E family transporter [Sphingosinicella sp.]|uniref:AI-2E family transporter n=1 Tax=Sphingosinicella sp. TaxID=1917971 RepID=UPI0035AF3A70
MSEGAVLGGRRRIPIRWILVAAIILWFAYATRGVLGPFIAGLVIAYLLDPVADRLEQRGVPRWVAAMLILVGFFGVFALLILAMAPLVAAQFQQLVQNLPQLIQSLGPLVERLSDAAGDVVAIETLSNDLMHRAAAWLSTLASGILSRGLAVFNLLALFVMMPVVAFYALRDYDALTTRINAWWPSRCAGTIRRLLGESDAALAGFVRGQSLVCLSLAIFYSVGWSLIGLNYALVLGTLAGVLGFVPYLGVVVSVGLGLLVGLGQWGPDVLHLGLIVGIFFVGQLLESTVLTPNLIGNRIGLHPLWVLFAVFAGGELLGILGVFLAVPVAAVLGVVMRWLLGEYLKSPLFLDDESPPEDVTLSA